MNKMTDAFINDIFIKLGVDGLRDLVYAIYKSKKHTRLLVDAMVSRRGYCNYFLTELITSIITSIHNESISCDQSNDLIAFFKSLPEIVYNIKCEEVEKNYYSVKKELSDIKNSEQYKDFLKYKEWKTQGEEK